MFQDATKDENVLVMFGRESGAALNVSADCKVCNGHKSITLGIL